jgi:hypothetical protein
MARQRTQAQREAEARHEEKAPGKTLVRHTPQSLADLRALSGRFEGLSDPELIRLALREMAARQN